MVHNELGNKNLVMGLILDLQNVFNTVNHDICINKLFHYGTRVISIKWFHSYSIKRPVVTTVNNFVLFADDSNVFIINKDIFQLFMEANVVINDLSN